jgi:hypothetical protein
MTLSKALISFVMLAISAAAASAHADEAAARLRLAALVEEAHLLLDELKTLDPTSAAVDAEGARLREADRALAGESAQLAKTMDQHNGAAAQLKRDLALHRQHCPKAMSDDAAIEACNARGAELMGRARELDAQYSAIQARRADLNRRIELHNSAWRDWQAVRREHVPRLDTNEADAQHWVDRAVAFMGSADFARLNALARSPAVCGGLRLEAARVHSGVRGMRRFSACLDAVSAALSAMQEAPASGEEQVEDQAAPPQAAPAVQQ